MTATTDPTTPTPKKSSTATAASRGTSTKDGVFTADPEGFREQNAGRPAAHLIRELAQNVFDEKATSLAVELSYDAATGVRYQVTDDVPGGIRDERLIWTIWMSDKADTATKRGRMGRGLKELISVSDHTLITTAGGPAIEFERVRGKWTRSSPIKKRPKAGSVVEGSVKLWKSRDLDAIVDYLRRMRPPEGLRFTVNGVEVTRRAAAERYELKLPTVVFVTEDAGRIARERTAETAVELFAEEQPWIYEMGIPVEAIDFPMSIDVGQRIPLREKRDTVTESFRRELFAKLLDKRMACGLVTDAQLRDNHVLTAAQDPFYLSTEAKRRIANVWTEGKPYATTPADLSAATGMHVPVVSLRGLPQAIRDITREVGSNVRDVMAQIQAVNCEIIGSALMSNAQRRFVACWEWLAAAVGRPSRVFLSTGKPTAIASYSPESKALTVYVDNFGSKIDQPFGAPALSDLIHELSHWTRHGDEHGPGFTSDSEDVGAQVAATLFEKAAYAGFILSGGDPDHEVFREPEPKAAPAQADASDEGMPF